MEVLETFSVRILLHTHEKEADVGSYTKISTPTSRVIIQLSRQDL